MCMGNEVEALLMGRLIGHTLEPLLAPANPFDKAFIGVLNMCRGTFIDPGSSLTLPLGRESRSCKIPFISISAFGNSWCEMGRRLMVLTCLEVWRCNIHRLPFTHPTNSRCLEITELIDWWFIVAKVHIEGEGRSMPYSNLSGNIEWDL